MQISYVDLLGVLRSKLVPRAAIGKMQKLGAGFAGYAAHFRMTAADPDVVWFNLPYFLINLLSEFPTDQFFCLLLLLIGCQRVVSFINLEISGYGLKSMRLDL